MEKLFYLLDKNTKIMETGFAIDLSTDTADWDESVKRLGIHRGYTLMAQHLCDVYRKRFGKEFLFSNECVAYEIEYHFDAYMWAMGYHGYIRNVTSYLYTREELISHCEVIDISTTDVNNFKQKTMFQYKKGIRACYKGTEQDPYRS